MLRAVLRGNLNWKLAVCMLLMSVQVACKQDLSVFIQASSPNFIIKSSANLISDESFTFSWSEKTGARFYDVVIADDASCQNIIFEKAGVEGTSLALKSLNDGKYFLCVYARAGSARLAAKNNGVSLIIDRTEPVVTIPLKTTVEKGPFNPKIQIKDLTEITIVWSQDSGEGIIQIGEPLSLTPMISANKNGLYTVKAVVTDQLGHRVEQIYQFYWNGSESSDLSFISLEVTGSSNDGYINFDERNDAASLWTLNQAGSTSIAYTLALPDPSHDLLCDAAQNYSQTTISRAADISVDGSYAICVRLTDKDGHSIYGKSETVVRDTLPPLFSSLVPANAALDGVIIDSEKLLVSPMWTLQGSGQILANFTAASDNSSNALVCDATLLYNQVQIPSPSSLGVDGTYAICVRLSDAAGNITLGKSASIVRDTVMPVIASFAAVNVAADGFINNSEKLNGQALWDLMQVGGSVTSFTVPLFNTGNAVSCDSSRLYNQSTIASASTLSSDGDWAICARVVSSTGNISYGKSENVLRDVIAPTFTSLALTGAASDGYISRSEKNLTSEFWILNAGGYSAARYSLATSDPSGTVVCDGSTAFSSSGVPPASSLTVDGQYSACVKLTDASGNSSFGKSALVIRDTVGPVLSSFVAANEASDGFINGSELSSSQSMWALVETGSVDTKFSPLLDDTGGSIVCNAAKTYSASTLPIVTDIPADGHYTICARLIDTLGNETYAKAPQVVRGTSGPIFGSLSQGNEASDGYINNAEKTSTSPLWTLSQSGGDTTVYTLPFDDSSGTAVCNASQTYGQSTIPIISSLVSDGTWVICAKITDAATNVVYGKAYPVIRDTVAPAFVSLARAGAAGDGFVNDSEKLLLSEMWALTATGYTAADYTDAGSDAGGLLSCNATVTYDQTIIPSPSALTADGVYGLCVKLTDAAGNISYGKSAQVTRDTVGATFVSLARAGAGADGFVNDSEKSLTSALWALGASDYIIASYTLALDDASSAVVCNSSQVYGESTPATPTGFAADGDYVICVKLVDAAGNAIYGKSAQINRDTAYPVLTSFTGANGASDGYVNNSEKNEGDPLSSFFASGYASVNYTAAFDDNSGTIACDASRTYSLSAIPLISSLTVDGFYVLCVTLVDAAGNRVYGKSLVIERKTTGPVFTSLLGSGDGIDNFVNDIEKAGTTALWTLSASGQITAVYTVALSNSPFNLVCDASKTYGQSSIPIASSLTVDGEYSLCVKLTDVAGNISYGKDAAVVRDIVYPSFASLLLVNEALGGYINNSEKGSTQNLAALSAAGYSQANYTVPLNDLSPITCDAGKTYNATLPTVSSVTSDGVYAVCVRLTDTAGNVTYGKSQQVTRDIVAPVVTVTSLSTTDLTPPLAGTLDDNDATVRVTVNNRTYNATVGTGAWTIADNALYMTGTGSYNVVAVAKDLAGNEGTDATTNELTITAPAFVSTWKTDNAGTSDSLSISLPLRPTGTYNFVVQWGDGTDSIITSATDPAATHLYNTIGTYTVKISGAIEGWAFKAAGDRLKFMTISNWGPLRMGNETGYFHGAANLTISATDMPNLSGMTTFGDMFKNCTALTAVPNIGSWDVSAITGFSAVFLGTSFNSNITGWNVSAATRMVAMFEANSVFNQDLSAWNTSNVNDMSYMFRNAVAFNGNISTWNTANVTNMQSMFHDAHAFNGDIGNWSTISLTNMQEMFKSATVFNRDLNLWNTSKVTTMYGLFDNAAAFNKDLNSWDTSKVTTMRYLFRTARAFNGNIGNWNVSKVTTMEGMFQDTNVFNKYIGAWTPLVLTNMYWTFYNAKVFNQDISSWNVSTVTNMGYTFVGALAFNQNIGTWNTSNVTNMANMFIDAKVFNGNISSWNVAKVTSMENMFKGAKAFNQNLSTWSVGLVTNMDSMFEHAEAFNGDISTWNTSKVTTMYDMFSFALAFNQNISSWNVAKVTSFNFMFYHAVSFNQPLTSWDVAKATEMAKMFNVASSFNQDLGNWSPLLVTAMDDMLTGAAMSDANYSSTLNGWNSKVLQNNVVLGAGTLKYSPSAAAARANLVNVRLWTITDGGAGP